MNNFFILSCALCFTCSVVYGVDKERISVSDGTIEYIFDVEIAKTSPQRRQGLMFRKKLHQKEGMLFVYPNKNDHTFWMMNTFIPLDILFFNDGKFQGAVKHARPHSLENLSIGKKSNQVLEINAGLADEMGVKEGWMLQRFPESGMSRSEVK